MPIDLLPEQQRLRTLGEIRIGHVVPLGGTDRNGKPKVRPAKLSKFRFTSPSKPLLEQIAAKYGGEVRAWTPLNGGAAEWEVFSTCDRLPVLVYGNATTEWFEKWDGGRCTRKCTGTREVISGGECVCDPDGVKGWWGDRECKPTTRLNVMLPEIDGIGMWLLVSKGRNAAETLPPLARFVAQSNGYVPAYLCVEEKVTHPEGKPPNRFMVPYLEVEQNPLELIAGRGGVQQSLTRGPQAPERKAIGMGSEIPDYAKLAEDTLSADAALQVYSAAEKAGHLNEDLKAKLVAIGKSKRAAEAAKVPTGNAVNDGEPAEAEVVDDRPEADRLWGLIVENTPDWSDDRRKHEFAARNEGLVPSSAPEERLGAFLQWLLNGSAQ